MIKHYRNETLGSKLWSARWGSSVKNECKLQDKETLPGNSSLLAALC